MSKPSWVAAIALVSWPAFAESVAPIDKAQDEFVHAHYKEAIAIARPLVGTEGAKAWRVIGASACFLKDRAQAEEAAAALDAKGKEFLGFVCKRAGVTL